MKEENRLYRNITRLIKEYKRRLLFANKADEYRSMIADLEKILVNLNNERKAKKREHR